MVKLVCSPDRVQGCSAGRRILAVVRHRIQIGELIVGVTRGVDEGNVIAEFVPETNGADVVEGRNAIGSEPVVGIARHRGGASIQKWDSRIGTVVLLLVQVCNRQCIGLADADRKCGRDAPTVIPDQIALRYLGGFPHGVEAQRGVAAQRHVAVGRRAIEIVAAEDCGRGFQRRQCRGLADLIDRPTRGAAAEENGRGPFDDLERIKIEAIARVDGRIANAVEEEVVERGETAQIDRVAARGTFTGIERDAGDIPERFLEACRGLILDELLADDRNRLRCVLKVFGQLVFQQRSDARDDHLIECAAVVGLSLADV